MRMREIGFGERRPIDAYGPGGFRIDGEWVAGSVLVSPRGVAPGSDLPGPGDAPAILEIAEEIDVLLVGLGPEIGHLDAGLRAALEAAGLGVEAMSTPSACRTYNVLLSEERRVAALLVALPR